MRLWRAGGRRRAGCREGAGRGRGRGVRVAAGRAGSHSHRLAASWVLAAAPNLITTHGRPADLSPLPDMGTRIIVHYAPTIVYIVPYVSTRTRKVKDKVSILLTL